MKLAVIYHYYELDQMYKDNLIYFVSSIWNENLDLYIVIAGEYTISLPSKSNITILEVENKNNDYGGYADLINSGLMSTNDYDAYLFVNSSVRGPFVPVYSDTSWSQAFTNRILNGDALVGSSINYLPSNSTYSAPFYPDTKEELDLSHIQTTAYALSKKALNHLIDSGFYSIQDAMPKDKVIREYEIGFTQQIRAAGFTVSHLLSSSVNQDDVIKHNFSVDSGDLLNKNGYYCRTLSPFELMFIKVNRKLIDEAELSSISYTNLLGTANNIEDWEERQDLIQRLEKQLMQVNKKQRGVRLVKQRLRWLLSKIGR